MKRKKKLQNQQIILSQDTHIKFYSNFLTFCSLNGFRLKYYYYYLKYSSIFSKLSNLVAINFYTNFYLMKIVSSAQLTSQFFYSYESFLLQKFVESKNLYLDNLNYIRYLSKLNCFNSNRYTSYNDFFNYKLSIDCNKEVSVTSSSIKYNTFNNSIMLDTDVNLNIRHYFFLKNFLFYLFILNMINIYKLNLILAMYTIHN